MTNEIAKLKAQVDFYRDNYHSALSLLQDVSTGETMKEYVATCKAAAMMREVMWASEQKVEDVKPATEKIEAHKAQDANETCYTSHMPF